MLTSNSAIHQVMYVISIQSEHHGLGPPVFRGMLETTVGQKFEFSTLAELNKLLCEVCGWIDTPPLAEEGGELTRFDGESLKSGCSSDQNPKEELK